MDENRAPDIPIRPPTVLYGGLGVGGLLGYTAPIPLATEGLRTVLALGAWASLAVSIAMMISACLAYRAALCVVTDGVFRWTRNPMYLSFCLMGAALALVFNELWLLVGTLPFWAYVRYRVIPEEERYMKRRFADAYERYKESTPRWL